MTCKLEQKHTFGIEIDYRRKIWNLFNTHPICAHANTPGGSLVRGGAKLYKCLMKSQLFERSVKCVQIPMQSLEYEAFKQLKHGIIPFVVFKPPSHVVGPGHVQPNKARGHFQGGQVQATAPPRAVGAWTWPPLKWAPACLPFCCPPYWCKLH